MTDNSNRASMTPEMVLAGPPIGPALATNMLLEKGADINAKDPQGRTLLMLAAAWCGGTWLLYAATSRNYSGANCTIRCCRDFPA
jgi:ankyrin repeat protein